MIYRFEILTENTVYEGWAHNPEEMSSKFNTEHPDVDHEIFPNRDKLRTGYAPKLLSLSEFRAYAKSGMSERQILELDYKKIEALGHEDEDFEFVKDGVDYDEQKDI